MKGLDAAPEILELARELGVSTATPVEAILNHCRCRVDSWVAEVGGVSTIATLEAIVTRRLQMTIEEISADDDFDRLKDVYAKGKGEAVFAAMRAKFDDATNLTYGALIQRRNATADCPDRFVAVIDCRGEKRARRFFTRWHEIAHRLTTNADIVEPVFRSEQDPIERMMDEIAGNLGFYEPLFQPAFNQASQGKTCLMFGTVEAIINSTFPIASFQATLFACARRVTTPVVYIEATLALKKEETRRLATASMFGEAPRAGDLRAVKVVPNAAARKVGFNIPSNMRVPCDSMIHRLYGADIASDCNSNENLNQWESKGKRLASHAVFVEARKVPDRVIALVQPLHPVTGKSQKGKDYTPMYSE